MPKQLHITRVIKCHHPPGRVAAMVFSESVFAFFPRWGCGHKGSNSLIFLPTGRRLGEAGEPGGAVTQQLLISIH